MFVPMREIASGCGVTPDSGVMSASVCPAGVVPRPPGKLASAWTATLYPDAPAAIVPLPVFVYVAPVMRF